MCVYVGVGSMRTVLQVPRKDRGVGSLGAEVMNGCQGLPVGAED